MNLQKKNLNNKVALEINNDLFSIVNIDDPINDKMIITTTNKSIEQLRTIFSIISNNIKVIQK